MRLLLLSMAVLATAAIIPANAQSAPHYHLVKRVELGGEGGWDYLIADPASHRVYISRGTHVIVVDPEKGATVADIPNTPGVHGIALAPKLHKGFISCGGANSVVVFDTRTFKETDRIKVGLGPDAILYDPASNRVFTFNGIGGDATAIDASTGKVAGAIAVGGKPEFAAADGKGRVYCNVENKSTILAIDSRTLAVLNTWPIAPGEEASGLAIDARNHRLFSVCHNGKMVVMNDENGKVVATPTIGEGPDAAGFDPGEKVAFSSNGDGTLTVVAEKSANAFEVTENVTTEPGARTMAVDTSNHNVYLVTAKLDPTPAPEGQRRRRRYLSGTFVMLVYAP